MHKSESQSHKHSHRVISSRGHSHRVSCRRHSQVLAEQVFQLLVQRLDLGVLLLHSLVQQGDRRAHLVRLLPEQRILISQQLQLVIFATQRASQDLDCSCYVDNVSKIGRMPESTSMLSGKSTLLYDSGK